MRRFLAGLGIGVLLSRLDVSAPQRVFEALIGRDIHILVLGVAALVASVLVRPSKPGVAWPACLVGLGVGVCGALPITAFVQIGEGRLSALFIVVGVLAGARLADALHSRDE